VNVLLQFLHLYLTVPEEFLAQIIVSLEEHFGQEKK